MTCLRRSFSSQSSPSVLSWGKGTLAGLGTGNYKHKNVPSVVPFFEGKRVTQLASSWTVNLALTEDGSVYSWGWRPSVRSVSRFARFGLQRFPRLINTIQQLNMGRFTFNGGNATPELVAPFGESEETQAVQVAVGGEHCAVITKDGRLWTWAGNFYGQCGHSDSWRDNFISTPKPVEPALKGRQVTHVSCGFQHSIAVTADGEAWSCGKAVTGALGIPSASAPTNTLERIFVFQPLQTTNRQTMSNSMEMIGPIKQVSAGFNHTLFLDVKGDVWASGKNTFGQLGHVDVLRDTAPKRVPNLSGKHIVHISAGQSHNLALTADGVVYTWGINRHGQCGRKPDEAVQPPEGGRNADLRDLPCVMLPDRLSVSELEDLFGRPAPRITHVQAGFYDSLLCTADGRVALLGSGMSLDGEPTRKLLGAEGFHVQAGAFGLAHNLLLGSTAAAHQSKLNE